MQLSVQEGYRLWAPAYDCGPNPLLALERRILQDRLGSLEGKILLDAGTGTGRWMKYAQSAGARTLGVDLSADMLALASGNRVRADIRRLPFADNAADIALCSMTVGYVRSFGDVLAELLRVAPRVIVSDLHPSAFRAGWTRSFRLDGEKYEIEHHCHSLHNLGADWLIEASFGESERHIFEATSKRDVFEDLQCVPAIYAACWTRAAA
jgi:SAM-dependent methyltransferase